jgi:hypothetical protein
MFGKITGENFLNLERQPFRYRRYQNGTRPENNYSKTV